MPLKYQPPKYADKIEQTVQTAFAGLDLRLSACDGAVCAMTNMSGDEYPLAAVRKGRRTVGSFESPQGVYSHDGLFIAADSGFFAYDDGEWKRKGSLSAGNKKFVSLGKYIIILPDKKCYDRQSGALRSLESSWHGPASFSDGTFAGEDAKGCRIVTTSTAFPFNVGDAVTISGASDNDNNKTIIIREISEDKKSLGFYENSFTVSGSQTIVIKRSVPDMDYICENENRLWGCKGSTIYSSKLGDPFNWNVFDGLASDSYSVDVGSQGDFTACFSYLGYPVFFKEDQIYKVFGSKPSNYQVMSSATLGVMKGSDASLAVSGEVLYYHSKVGIMAYSGGVPQCVSSVLGDRNYSNAVGGSDGKRYYVSLLDGGSRSLNCFDTISKQWYREDELDVIGFAYDKTLHALTSSGALLSFRDDSPDEGMINSELEFADFVEESPNKKSTAKLLIRVGLEENSTLNVLMSFDGGEYISVSTLASKGKRSYYLPIQLRRCDRFRIKLKGTGNWRMYSLTREFSKGSAN